MAAGVCAILKTEKAAKPRYRPDRLAGSGYFFSNTLAKMAKTNTTTAKSSSSIRLTSFLGSGETPEGPVFVARGPRLSGVPAWKMNLWPHIQRAVCPFNTATFDLLGIGQRRTRADRCICYNSGMQAAAQSIF